MKRIYALILVCILLMLGNVSYADEEFNITSCANVSASSFYPGMPKENAVDSSPGSVWSNGYYPSGGNFLRLDFDMPVKISKITLLMFNSPGYNKNFEVRLSSSDPFSNYDLLLDQGTEALTQEKELFPDKDKKYTSVLVISKGVNGMLGISEIGIFSSQNLAKYANVLGNKKISGGENSKLFPPSALTDGNTASYAAIENGSVIDIDLAKREKLELLKFVWPSSSAGGNRKNIHILASDYSDFREDCTEELCAITEDSSAQGPYVAEVSGEYRYIRVYTESDEFTPLAELSIYGFSNESFGRWIITDSNGEETNDIFGKELKNISVNIERAARDNYTAIAILYDENDQITNVGYSTGKTGELVVDISSFGVIRKGCRLSVMLFDNMLKQNAVCAPLEME